jgi:hypothetical protein
MPAPAESGPTESTTPAASAPATAPSVAEVLSAVDEARLRAHVQALAGVGSRHAAHPGHAAALRYLEDNLRGAGLRVRSHARGVSSQNVYALAGPGEVPDILVSAHYDSIANNTPGWQPARDPAPGANDNATGVIGDRSRAERRGARGTAAQVRRHRVL